MHFIVVKHDRSASGNQKARAAGCKCSWLTLGLHIFPVRRRRSFFSRMLYWIFSFSNLKRKLKVEKFLKLYFSTSFFLFFFQFLATCLLLRDNQGIFFLAESYINTSKTQTVKNRHVHAL